MIRTTARGIHYREYRPLSGDRNCVAVVLWSGSESAPDLGTKDRRFRLALAAPATFGLLLSFVSVYALGDYAGSVPVRTIRDGQAKILLLVAPVGFSLIVGAATTFLPVRAGRHQTRSVFAGQHC
jgi:hypothetical protein